MTNLKELAILCQKASVEMARADTATKNAALVAIADALNRKRALILAGNAKDLAAGKKNGLSDAMLDRLKVDDISIDSMIQGIQEIIALSDPVGEIEKIIKRPSGIKVGRMRIPLGVIGIIYESRPNVTVDAAVLCLKAGNATFLRGGSEAFHSNLAISQCIAIGLEDAGLPTSAVTLVPGTDRALVSEMLTLSEQIDLIIPRGGEGLIRYVSENSRIPVIQHYKGVCHLYADKMANCTTAIKLAINGKVSRPGVCNSLETLLIHKDIADELLPQMAQALFEKGVEIRGCEKSQSLVTKIKPASKEDYHAEYLALIITVKIVDDYQQALNHIQEYGSNHTEVIVTEHYQTAQNFLREVNSSVVMVNASSRFSDGGQLGLGAEIGISTSKLHAYGPMGIESLTTQKFIVMGEGQVRL